MRDGMGSALGASDGSATGAKGFFAGGDLLARKPHVLERERTYRRNILQMGNRVRAQSERAAMFAIGGDGRGLMTENLQRERIEVAGVGRGNEGENLVVNGGHQVGAILKRNCPIHRIRI